VPIGRVTDDGIFRVRHEGRIVAAIPGERLVDDCPMYQPEAREGEAAVARREAAPARSPKEGVERALEVLLDDPTIASKRWVYEQYDTSILNSTILPPGGDAGVLRVPGTDFALAVTVDCNQRLVALDPYEGGKACVAEAARNVACTGALPLGITDCLNFGNPQKPEVFFQFREACRGIGEACVAFETPVTGGNVSFYNESPTGAIDPSPMVGMVGLLERAEHRVPSHFQGAGDPIVLLGATAGHLGGSAYWAEVCDFAGGRPAPVDLAAERALQLCLVAAAKEGLLRSAHDCADGGLLVALAEAAMGAPYVGGGLGAQVALDGYADGVAAEALLYGEDGARAVVSCAPETVERLLALAASHRVPAFRAGRVEAPGTPLVVAAAGRQFTWNVDTLRDVYFEAIPRRMRHADADRSTGE
jgi:phosphoribosylformylglycinamidine synthase subunit PurL